jgi:hypothetical protein
MDMNKQFEKLSFSVLNITICSLMGVVIEMDSAYRFTSQIENDYYLENFDKIGMKFIIYT